MEDLVLDVGYQLTITHAHTVPTLSRWQHGGSKVNRVLDVCLRALWGVCLCWWRMKWDRRACFSSVPFLLQIQPSVIRHYTRLLSSQSSTYTCDVTWKPRLLKVFLLTVSHSPVKYFQLLTVLLKVSLTCTHTHTHTGFWGGKQLCVWSHYSSNSDTEETIWRIWRMQTFSDEFVCLLPCLSASAQLPWLDDPCNRCYINLRPSNLHSVYRM